MKNVLIGELPPDCCFDCEFHDWDIIGDYGPGYDICMRGLMFPTRKKTCKIKKKREFKNA